MGPPLSFHPQCSMLNPLWLEVVKKPAPTGICGGKWGSAHVLGVSQLPCVVCKVVGWPSPDVVCSQELHMAALAEPVRKSWAKPLPSRPGCLWRVEGGLGFSHLLAPLISDASGKTASEILQRPGSGQPLPDRRGELGDVFRVGKKQ